jgi:hypothetical protein
MPNTPKGLSVEKAARMMIALRKGQTLRIFGAGSARIEAYFLAHPDYAREARPLIEANRMAAKRRKGERLRNLTHCVHGHPFSGANLSFRPNGKRDCLTCVRRRAVTPPPPTQTQIEQVTAALNMGKTLGLICQGSPGDQGVKRIVSFSKLGLYRKQNPGFDKFVISATAHNNSRGQLKRHHPEQLRLQIVRSQNDDFQQILACCHRGSPIGTRSQPRFSWL